MKLETLRTNCCMGSRVFVCEKSYNPLLSKLELEFYYELTYDTRADVNGWEGNTF
jgi:hypothetical protein